MNDDAKEQDPYAQVSLDNLGHGAAKELFDIEFGKVLENILDPNTDAKKIREVTIKLSILPNKDRDGGAYEIKATSKLAPVMGYSDHLILGRKGKDAVAYQNNLKQGDMFKDPADREKLTVLRRGEAK